MFGRKKKHYEGPRFSVQPPVGMPGSGQFCWWTVKDQEVDLSKHGNNITDYVFAGLPDAEERARGLAESYNNGTAKPPRSPINWGGPG